MVLKYIKNQVLKSPVIDAQSSKQFDKSKVAKKDIRITIVEYPFMNYPEYILLSLQDKNKIKKPFVHKLNTPLYGFFIQEYECIENDFISGKRAAWYSELLLASKETDKKNIEKRKRAEKLEAKLNQKMNIIHDFFIIPEALELYVKGTYPSYVLNEIAVNNKINLSTVYRTLNIYFAFGRCKEALIPSNHKIGKAREIPKNLRDGREKYPHGLGRPRNVGGLNQRAITEFDHSVKAQFSKSLSLSSPNHLHQLFTLFCVKLKEKLITDNPHLHWDDYKITRNQFISLFKKHTSEKQRLIAKEGIKNYKNNRRALTSTARHNIPFPTARYEIDSTTLDVYLLSIFTDLEGKKPIRRPTLYTVYDTYSGCVVGFHLTLDGNTEESFLMAMHNAFTDKVAFAAQHGITIKKTDWPCNHICSEILFDRGTEFKDKKVSEILESKLGILGVSFTESYMGSNKGTVETGFKSLKADITDLIKARVDKDKPKSTQHASQKASLTMPELYKVLIIHFVSRNHSGTAIEKRDLEACINNIEPTPQSLFNYGLKTKANGGVVRSNKDILLALLPRFKVMLTKQAFEVNRPMKGQGHVKLKYQTDNNALNKHREAALNALGKGIYEIEVMILPNWIDHIWYCGPITDYECIEFKLSDRSRRFSGLYGDDIENLGKQEFVLESLLRDRRQNQKEAIAKLIIEFESGRVKDLRNVKKTSNKSVSKHLDENTKLDLMCETKSNAQRTAVVLVGGSSSLLDDFEKEESNDA